MDISEKPTLQFLHGQNMLNRVKLDRFRNLGTDELKFSLMPGQPGSLKARPDGTVLDGHHRLSVLGEHGENIHQLPRDIIERDAP